MTEEFSEEEKVRALYQDLLTQWNEQKAQGMAALFTEDGNMIGFDGSQINRAKEIESYLESIFTQYPTARFINIVREVRLIGPNVALVRSEVGMVPRGYSDINPAVNAVQSMITVKQNGQWKVALFQNTPAAFHGRPEDAEKLSQELREVLYKQVHTN